MPTSVFYRQFERHDHAAGIKAHTTTYCPGCGHGLAQKYLAEAIDELGVQDRTVLVSPVGCSVFSYYYFDVGNTQAAHGRAPAVAIGHKTANPDSIVVCYQGDGDLASIGLAEIISAAQLGMPMTVIFVNNAIYGMTGGQMAPTTLLGQRTTTSPTAGPRSPVEPLKVAELIAGLDGPRLRRAGRALRQPAPHACQARDQEGPPAPGRRRRVRVDRSPLRVPDPPRPRAGGRRGWVRDRWRRCSRSG